MAPSNQSKAGQKPYSTPSQPLSKENAQPFARGTPGHFYSQVSEAFSLDGIVAHPRTYSKNTLGQSRLWRIRGNGLAQAQETKDSGSGGLRGWRPIFGGSAMLVEEHCTEGLPLLCRCKQAEVDVATCSSNCWANCDNRDNLRPFLHTKNKVFSSHALLLPQRFTWECSSSVWWCRAIGIRSKWLNPNLRFYLQLFCIFPISAVVPTYLQMAVMKWPWQINETALAN